MQVPPCPARPVLPDRWIYCTASFGGCSCKTSFTSAKSMPRLIMSVEIRTSNLGTCRFAKSYTVLQIFRCAMGLKTAVAKPRNKQPRRSLHKSIKERNSTVGNTQTTRGNTHNLSCASLSLSLSRIITVSGQNFSDLSRIFLHSGSLWLPLDFKKAGELFWFKGWPFYVRSRWGPAVPKTSKMNNYKHCLHRLASNLYVFKLLAEIWNMIWIE